MNLYLLKINIRDNRTISMKMSVMFVIFLTLSSFHVTGLFLYSLKTLENISLVLWCFRGYRKRPVAWNDFYLEIGLSVIRNFVICIPKLTSYFTPKSSPYQMKTCSEYYSKNLQSFSGDLQSFWGDCLITFRSFVRSVLIVMRREITFGIVIVT